MQLVTGLGIQLLETGQHGLRAERVDQGQRSDRVATTEPHRGVDVVVGRVAALVHRRRVVQVRQHQYAGNFAPSVAGGQSVDDLLHAYS